MGWGKGPGPGGSPHPSHKAATEPFPGSPAVQANWNISMPVDPDLRKVNQAHGTGLGDSGGQGHEHGLPECAE